MPDLLKWDDTATVESILRGYFLGDYLSNCIVEEGYRPPPSLTSGLKLTQRGTRLAHQIKGKGVDLREAQLAMLISPWLGSELLFDFSNTDFDVLRQNISAEIKRRNIKLPWIYGKKWYDHIAEAAFHGNDHLTHKETLGVLENLPQGVFQLGPYVSGPYGLIEGRHWRLIHPRKSIPAYHCEEPSCDRVHSVRLATGESKISSAINILQEKSSKVRGENKEVKVAVDALIIQKLKPIIGKTIPLYRGSWRNASPRRIFAFLWLVSSTPRIAT